MEKLTRRTFFKAAGATAAVAAAKAHALAPDEAQHAHGAAAAPASGAPAQPAYLFLRPDEARFAEAAVARLIPLDVNGPGALEAGLPNYIDRQRRGAWGAARGRATEGRRPESRRGRARGAARRGEQEERGPLMATRLKEVDAELVGVCLVGAMLRREQTKAA
ncbi:gluconate 2-dehydrogenase subunit 3 family protein [Telluria antibiotica]|uniref:gluconate 2-dehydrogenase subunit 3 family protein n=1 Tax=Telluria antibiotica TaxID=2717319 RepID=UPI00280A8442|nr:gluconate 2-dehydrogenase subunit 3 family protein [Telluria antibiotica]